MTSFILDDIYSVTGIKRNVLPTGSVKVECSPPERKVVSTSHSRVIPKT